MTDAHQTIPDSGTANPRPLDRLVGTPMNQIKIVNNHAEIHVGKRRALIDLQDVDLVRPHKWTEHPRGPITETIISKKPRRRSYKLMAMMIHGRRFYPVDGNRYDLRRSNTTDIKMLPGAHSKRGVDCGVYQRHGKWCAHIRIRNRQLRKQFSIRKYGNAQAHTMAKEARQLMVKLGIDAARERLKKIRRIPKAREINELKAAPPMEQDSILHLAEMYAEREKLPSALVPHLHRMLLLGGGRMPKLEHKKDLAPINIYEGNQEYENCVVEVERDEETGETVGFQPY